MSEQPKIICLDFDGVIHSYASGWQGANVVADDPVPGALEFICEVLERPDVTLAIYSARSGQPGGIEAMQAWLAMHLGWDLSPVQAAISWPTSKPPALVTLDDRAVQFLGTFPPVDELVAFEPWNKRTGCDEGRREVKAKVTMKFEVTVLVDPDEGPSDVSATEHVVGAIYEQLGHRMASLYHDHGVSVIQPHGHSLKLTSKL